MGVHWDDSLRTHVIGTLQAEGWVHVDDLAHSIAAYTGGDRTRHHVAQIVHRLRNEMSIPIERGTFYRMSVTDTLENATLKQSRSVTRGRPRQSDARIVRAWKGSGEIAYIATEFWAELGRPKHMRAQIDQKHGTFALRPCNPDDAGAIQMRPRVDGRRHVEATITGLFELLNVPISVRVVTADCKVVQGMMLFRPQPFPHPCATCHGTGVNP